MSNGIADSIFRSHIEAMEQLELERLLLKSDELKNKIRICQARMEYLGDRREFWQNTWTLALSNTPLEFKSRKKMIKQAGKLRVETARMEALNDQLTSLGGRINRLSDRLAFRRR